MKLFTWSRNVRLFITSVLDQVLLSAGNFLIGFLLIRHTTDFDYGLFVLVQSAILLLVSTQSSCVSGPLTVVVPHKTPEKRAEMIGSIERSLRRVISSVAVAAFVVPIVCYVRGTWDGLETLVVVLAIFAGWVALVRDYARGILLILARPHTLLYADIVYVAIMVCGALFSVFGPVAAVLSAVGTLLLAGAAGWFAAYHAVGRDPGWHGNAAIAGPYWAELRSLGIWSAVGSVVYWLYGQSYNYMLASRLDLTAVADVNAARLLLMPSFILTTGIKSLLAPLAANWLAKEGTGAMLRRVWLIVPAIVLLNLCYMILIWFGRDLITTDLLHKVIRDREMLLVMWAAIVLVTLIRDMLQAAVIVLGRLQSLAWLSAASAMVALPMIWFGIGHWGAAGALIGQICGEGVSLMGVLWLLPKAVKRYERER
ncbi:MAG: hypothetical protein QM718_04610 [Steroidobacteraceae bacterium]